MSHDESFYDFLRSKEDLEAQAKQVSKYTSVLTVCSAEDKDARPLYDCVFGSVCMYVKEQRVLLEGFEPVQKQIDSLVFTEIRNTIGTKFGEFFVEEESVEEHTPTTGSCIVDGDKVIGAVLYRSIYAMYKKKSNCRVGRTIFLPIDGQLRQTCFDHTENYYGEGGKIDFYEFVKFAKLEKK